MRWWKFIFAWWVLCLAARALAPAWVVATYNIENYGEVGRRIEGVYEAKYPKPEAEKKALREVVRRLNADVLALQEMGSAAHLAELQRDLKQEGCDYPYAAWLEAEDKDRHLAVLARVPLRVTRHTEVPLAGGAGKVKRGVLEVSWGVGAQSLTLFVVHFKSRLTETSQDPEGREKRGKEAEAVRKLIASKFSDEESGSYLVMGDFNDGPRSRAVRALCKKGERRLAECLDAADGRGEHWTHRYGREDSYSRFDYVLASTDLLSKARLEARIEDGEGTEKASDHRPVVISLWYTDRKVQTPASTLAP